MKKSDLHALLHQLSTPATAILLNLEMLHSALKDPRINLSAEAKEFLQDALAGTYELQKIIQTSRENDWTKDS